MKRPLFTGILIFSLALNIAVAATVGWHLWQQRAVAQVPTVSGPALTQQDVRQIGDMMPQQRRQWMMQARRQVLDKKSQVLDQIARNPGDLKAVEPTIRELLDLKNTMERQALVRISLIMGNLPEEKRAAFLDFLKTRACGGGGMGWGRGRHRGCSGPGKWEACPAGNQNSNQATP